MAFVSGVSKLFENISIRHMSAKKLRKKRQKNQGYGLKFKEGDIKNVGAILATQIWDDYYPGYFTSMARDKSITAMITGRVYTSYLPIENENTVKKFEYSSCPTGKKLFIHIIPPRIPLKLSISEMRTEVLPEEYQEHVEPAKKRFDIKPHVSIDKIFDQQMFDEIFKKK